MRLASIYSLLDLSNAISEDHLEAALAVWEYCEASCKYIFGDSLGDPVSERILGALRESPNGLSRSQIRDLFLRHKSKDEVDRALRLLQARNLAYGEARETNGRPEERWQAVKR